MPQHSVNAFGAYGAIASGRRRALAVSGTFSSRKTRPLLVDVSSGAENLAPAKLFRISEEEES